MPRLSVRSLLARLCWSSSAEREAAATRRSRSPSLDGTSLAGGSTRSSNRPAPASCWCTCWRATRTTGDDLPDASRTPASPRWRSICAGMARSAGSASELAGDGAGRARRHRSGWRRVRTCGPTSIGVVGASLGANLAALAAADLPPVRALALISPSLDYRGVRLDRGLMKKLGEPFVWLAASTEDPWRCAPSGSSPRRVGAARTAVSSAAAHGTVFSRAIPTWRACWWTGFAGH